MDEKKFEEILIRNNQILIKNTQTLINELEGRMNKKFEQVYEKFDEIDQKFNGVDQEFEGINQKIEKMEQKRIDDNCYFEHKYWDKISIIFDNLKSLEEMYLMEDESHLELKNQVEQNSTKIMLHEFQIARLEKSVNSK